MMQDTSRHTALGSWLRNSNDETFEQTHMQQSKLFITRLLPTCLALMALLLTACGGTTATITTASSKAPAAQQVLNMSFSAGTSDIKTFDPALSTDFASIAAIDLVFTGLVQLNDRLAVQPQLASSYQEGKAPMA